MAKRPSVFEALGGSSKAARPAGPSWRVCSRSGGVYLFRDDPASKPSAKVAAFDMVRRARRRSRSHSQPSRREPSDTSGARPALLTLARSQDGTLVLHASDFATHAGDWRVFNDRVFPVLRRLHTDGYRLVVFSNQGGIKSALDGKRASTTKGYFDAFAAALAVPLLAFAAPQDDAFKKGKPGMWHALVAHHQGGVEPEMEQCFFVGDAAGREATSSRKKDHGRGDKDFAEALKLKFYLPEEVFGSSPPPWELFPQIERGGGGEAAAAAAAKEEEVDNVIIID